MCKKTFLVLIFFASMNTHHLPATTLEDATQPEQITEPLELEEVDSGIDGPCNPALYNPIYYMYTDDPWRFIEQFFLVNAEKKYNNLFPTIARNFAATWGLIPGAWIATRAIEAKFDMEKRRSQDKNIAEKYGIKPFTHDRHDHPVYLPGQIKKEAKKWVFIHAVASAFTSVILPALSYKIVSSLTKSYFEHAILENFIIHWEVYKQFTPEELHKTFDGIHENYLGSSEEFQTPTEYIKSISRDVVSQLQNAVRNKYPEKYPDTSSSLLHSSLLKWSILGLIAASIALKTTKTTYYIREMNKEEGEE